MLPGRLRRGVLRPQPTGVSPNAAAGRGPLICAANRPKELAKTNLKHTVQGKQVVVSGKCSCYPCSKNGWRCETCVKLLEASYQQVIATIQDENKQVHDEVAERRVQMQEMRKVIDLANEQMPLLQQQTQQALSHAASCEASRDKLKLDVADLQQQLVLAGTETVQDRLRDTEAQLAKCQEALVDTRHELAKSKHAAGEWRKQQRLASLDLANYRRYIKKAREKEHSLRAEMAAVNKRQIALALELAQKDESAIELKRRIEDLSRVAEETFEQQQVMQHQNDGLLDVVQQLSHALEEAAHTEDEMRKLNADMRRNQTDQTAEMAQLHGAVAILRNETLSTKSILAREKMRRKDAEEAARCNKLLYPQTSAPGPPVPPKTPPLHCPVQAKSDAADEGQAPELIVMQAAAACPSVDSLDGPDPPDHLAPAGATSLSAPNRLIQPPGQPSSSHRVPLTGKSSNSRAQ